MGLLKALGTGQGYLKAGFLGFPKAGKTYTSIELAIGTRSFMEAKGPIAMFDTEGGSEYIAERVRKATGQDLVGVRSMALSDLIQTVRECEASGVSVLVVDSITHVWREVCDSYLKQVNASRVKRKLPPRQSLEFQDWKVVKDKWAEWTTLYLNSKLHIIICGRAGFEYDYEKNEETGRKELVKTGTKMKTESEFGFEPSLLVEMERVKVNKKHVRKATILGDRFGLIDAKECNDPTFAFFKPHVAKLKPGAHAPIDTELKTDHAIDDDGNDDRRRKTIYLEQIENVLVLAHPTTSVKDKTAKLKLLDQVFGSTSWTQITGYPADRLKRGLDELRTILEPKEGDDVPPPIEEQLEQVFNA